MEKEIRLVLTDSEWISLIDGSDDHSGLPTCCANISALRFDLITIIRNGRNNPLSNWEVEGLIQKLQWCYDGHDLEDLPVIQKICKQIGFEPKTENKHEPQQMEL